MNYGIEKCSPRKKKNFDRCVVKGCGSSASNLELHFHKFPKPNECVVSVTNWFGKVEQVDKLKAWKIALKISTITPHSKVCSLHFKKSDYILPDISSNRRRLKKIAVPFLAEKNTERNKLRLERQVRRSNRMEVTSSLTSTTNESSKIITEETNSTNTDYESDLNNDDIELNSLNENSEFNEKVNIESFIRTSTPASLSKDIEIQVNTTDIQRSSFCNNITTDSELSTVTGIESFKVLNTILQIIDYAKADTDRSVKMSLKERVMMTFFKLKHNVSYSLLSVVFKCHSVKHCLRIFQNTVKMLSFCLKPAIVWPSREEIRKNLPECFQSFEDVRVVLDCTEIFIQRPGLCCQILTDSHYKGGQTCKIMTGFSPSGNITFISKCYGGRATNSTIFKQSDLMNLLEPGDAVMVDQGFLINEICKINRWKCIRPPFLKEKKQFSKEESVLTAKIAKARVHIERCNQRIKNFKIFGSVMPVALVPLIEDICIIICAVINMSSPIISDSKFMK